MQPVVSPTLLLYTTWFLISLDARISVYKSTQNGINNIISCTGVYIFISTPETHAMLVINTRDKSGVVMMLMSGADSA